MTKHSRFIFLFLSIFLSLKTSKILGQSDELIKTTEYSGTLKRRDMFLNKDMNVVQESYYSEDSKQIVNTIYYDNSGKLLRLIGYENYPKITFDVDFSKGTYVIPENKTILKFKNRFVFDGLQKGDNIVVNYLNGVRQGRLIQTDSAEYGKKTVVYQKPNLALLKRFNILQFYDEIGDEDTYKLYKGLILNFSNNQLNGRQLGYFVNGALKIKANFLNGNVLNYTSLNQEGSTLSNIVADSNAIVRKPYILNGVIEREKLNVSFKNTQLQNTGKISFRDDFETNNDYSIYFFDERYYNGEKHLGDLLEIVREASEDGSTIDNYFNVNTSKSLDLKKLFDDKKFTVKRNNPHVLRMLFKIPFFYIQRFDFERNDQTDLEDYDGTDSEVGEQQAEFPGGPEAWKQYLDKNLKWPRAAAAANVTGKVLVSFVVNTDGSIQDVKVVEGRGFGCDEEAIRVIRAVPRWNPGRQSGRAVQSRYTQQVNFAFAN